MKTNIILVLVNVAAVGAAYASGHGVLILLTIVSLIIALIALVRTLEDAR